MTFFAPRAVLRAVLFAGLTGALLVPYLVLLAVAPGQRHRIAGLFFKGCLALTGLKVQVHGTPQPDAAIYAANHASYLDIPVLGAVLSHGVFIAKREVAGWPLFGFLARIARTQFVSRSGTDAPAQRAQLARRIRRGESLILFPEGTSTDGSHVRPFKSALFSALDDAGAVAARVQPLTIVYARHLGGTALSRADRERYTWFGDMTLAPHLWAVFGSKGCQVDIVFHPPLCVTDVPDRKALAKRCEAAVRTALHAVIGVERPALDESLDKNTQEIAEPVLSETAAE